MRPLRAASALLLAAVVLAGCGGTATQPVKLVGGPDHVLPFGWLHGFNVTAYNAEGYSTPEARAAIGDLAATGVGQAVFAPVVYQAAADSSSVAPDAEKTPSMPSLLAGMRAARAAGLQVGVKPHVDVLDGTFRGDIDPMDRAAWFESYTALLVSYARVAQEAGAKLFVVGTELTRLQGDTARWRQVIVEVRRVFSGKLTYAANWSPGPDAVSFWDRLDYVGVDAYWPLKSATGRYTVRELQAAWQPYVRELTKVAKKFDRPALLTEIGYPARVGSPAQPTGEDTNAGTDREVQARAYEAAYRVWRRVPRLAGLLWWEWATDGRNRAVGGYSPAEGAAIGVVRRYATGE